MIDRSRRSACLALAVAAALSGTITPSAVIAGAPPSRLAFTLGPILPHNGFPIICLTDYQVRQRLASYGYSRIYLNVPNGHRIQARATKGRWIYLIEMNRCTGRIISRTALRAS